MTTTTDVDANLHHAQVLGRAVTSCLQFVNTTPSNWHTKSQATVETATFGSEFVAARILQTKSWISGTPSCILEFQSDQKATCLVKTNPSLTVQAFPLLLVQEINLGFLP